MPRTPFIGVRISWLMFATNSDLSRDASSAAVWASASETSACRRSVRSRTKQCSEGVPPSLRHIVSSAGNVRPARSAEVTSRRSVPP